ncbi:hypothetical protein [Pseudanabaena sp. UWO310]|uniref:hypothetical protein n=1 Tax=Pseudanabaena sp. UWO310 TaxID=2480795 RepID=UPI001CC1D982|nr:hypothetical protein [Pseudanabaena sp. UWO310]
MNTLVAEPLELSNPVLRGLRRSNLLTAECDFLTAQPAVNNYDRPTPHPSGTLRSH